MIKRAGVIFILYPVWILCIILHVVFIVTSVIWGPIYYIITGLDPMEDNITFFFIMFAESFHDWYMNKFGPNE